MHVATMYFWLFDCDGLFFDKKDEFSLKKSLKRVGPWDGESAVRDFGRLLKQTVTGALGRDETCTAFVADQGSQCSWCNTGVMWTGPTVSS